MERVPCIDWRPAHPGDEPGTQVGIALGELAAYALENGCGEDELRERLEEAIERTGE